MRLLLVGISGLALTACSMNGYEYGAGHGASSWSHPDAAYAGCYVDPCAAAHMPAPQTHYQQAHYQTGYLPPAQPVTWTPPATLPPPPPCTPNPCAGGTYSVAPQMDMSYGAAGYGSAIYGHAAPQVHTPAAHAYGTHVPAYGPSHGYGLRGALAPRQPYKYGTIGATWYDLDEPFGGIQGRLGYQSASILGAEIEGSIGVINQTSEFDQANPPGPNLVGESKIGVDYQIAGFGVARLPISPNISLHGRAGYHQTKLFADLTVNGIDASASATEDGLAYGAGAEFNITPVDALRADYTRYDVDGGDLDSLSLSYLRRF